MMVALCKIFVLQLQQIILSADPMRKFLFFIPGIATILVTKEAHEHHIDNLGWEAILLHNL